MTTQHAASRLALRVAALAALLAVAVVRPSSALAYASSVYHQQTDTPVQSAGGTSEPQCGNYFAPSHPGTLNTVTVRARVQYAGATNNADLYYTTNGSSPTVNSDGTPQAGTTRVTGVYSCTFSEGQTQSDQVVTFTIPAQSAGTKVTYIIGAYFSCAGAGGPANDGCGPTVFANSTSCNTSSCATQFSYIVALVTAASYSHLQTSHVHGTWVLRWYSPLHVLGFDVFRGKQRLNRTLVVSRTHWYRFVTRRVVRRPRLIAVWPDGHSG